MFIAFVQCQIERDRVCWPFLSATKGCDIAFRRLAHARHNGIEVIFSRQAQGARECAIVVVIVDNDDRPAPAIRRARCDFFRRAAFRGTSIVKRFSSLSIRLAHRSQSQIPFVSADRSSGVRDLSYRMPPGAAAVMCEASPTLTTLFASSAGPDVDRMQPGLEHLCPTRPASSLLVAAKKLSRTVILFMYAG